MLHGELVTLRAFRPEDVDVLFAGTNDVETELFSGGGAPTPTPRESVVELWERRRNDRNSVDFIIEADGKVIGELGLFDPNHVARTMELGITVVDKEYWGRGYGSEAVRLAVDYGFRFRNVRKVCLTVLANNPRAIKAYAKAGFVEEGRRKLQVWNGGEYVDEVLMGVFRPDA
jgi:RimJ/RimL family protein N-acetyltransferase